MNTNDVRIVNDRRVEEVKTRLANANRTRVTAELRHDQATGRAEQILAHLQQDFNVTSTEEAKALLARMQADVVQKIAELTAVLDAAEQ